MACAVFFARTPNVIMVGEIRDLETAEIANRAALTGHLVFSTLHTNDSIGGVARLVDMGVEPFLVGASVRAFIAQRLVRRLCDHCKQPAGIQTFDGQQGEVYSAVGCEACRNTGYHGRLALYEVFSVSKAIEEVHCQRGECGRHAVDREAGGLRFAERLRLAKSVPR